MHPQDFRSIVDHLYDGYCTLHEEIHRLRKENKVLADELNKARALNTTLSAKLCNLKSAKVLKMGADWFFDGDFLLNMTLERRLKFNSPICNARISQEGKIAFTCNGKIFLCQNSKIFLVEEKMVPFDMRMMKHDLVDLERRIFDFLGERLIVYSEGMVMMMEEDGPVWIQKVEGGIHVCTDNNRVYLGTEDGVIHIYEEDGTEKESMDTGGEFGTFVVKNGQVMLAAFDCITLLPGYVHIEPRRLLATDFDGESVYYGGVGGVIGMARPSGNSLQTYDTLTYKSTVLSVHRWRDFLLIATEDKTVNVVDLEAKKQMRIVLMDNVVDICSNKDFVCYVDNNGGLRIWKMSG